MEVLALERADRADVGGADRVVIVETAVVDVEHRMVAQIENRELAGLADFAAKAHAAPAQDASFLIEQHAFADVDALLMLAARLERARVAAAKAHRVVLQPALAGLVADRAVQRMVDQQQFEHAAARQRYLRVRRMHDHPVAHLRVARDLQLRHPLDLHLAEAATAVDAELGMVAVVRDVEPGVEHHLQQGRALGRFDRAAVDRDFHDLGCVRNVGLRRASRACVRCHGDWTTDVADVRSGRGTAV